MGVKGLWKLLEPVGRPVTLESLENKVLGVGEDVSLLLNQSVKGIRDKDGKAVPNAHLVGLFHRVCKLLFYRIKPVFVFDGGVPHLKKKTLAERRERRMKAMHGSSKAAERIMKNYLKGKALEAVTGQKSSVTVRSASPKEPDLFELLPLAQQTASQESSSDEEDMDISALEQSLEAEFANPSGIDVESVDFKALTPEIQHELIMDMKQERKYISVTAMPQASNFSDFQLEGVLKRGRLNLRLDELRKEMANRNAGQVAGLASQDSVLEESTVKSQRIMSEDTGHYILIKSGEQQQQHKSQEDSPMDLSLDGGFIPDGTEYQILSRDQGLPKQSYLASPPSFEIPDTDSSDEENVTGRQVKQPTVKEAENQETQDIVEITRSDVGDGKKGQVQELRSQGSEEKVQTEELSTQGSEKKVQTEELSTQGSEEKVQTEELSTQGSEEKVQTEELSTQGSEEKVQTEELVTQGSEEKVQTEELITQGSEEKVQTEELVTQGSEEKVQTEELSTQGSEEKVQTEELSTQGSEEKVQTEELVTQGSEEKVQTEELITQGSEEKVQTVELSTQGSEEKGQMEELITQGSEEKVQTEELSTQGSEEKVQTEELVTQGSEEKGQMEELITQGSEEKGQMEELITQGPEEKVQTEELSTQGSEEKGQMEELITQGSEEKVQTEELITQGSEEKVNQTDCAEVSVIVEKTGMSLFKISDPDMKGEQSASQQDSGEIKDTLSAAVTYKKGKLDRPFGKYKIKESNNVLIDLTIEPPNNDDKVVLCSEVFIEERRVIQPSGNHKNAVGKKMLIDLTVEADDKVVMSSEVINQEGRVSRLYGNHINAEGKKMLIDLTLDNESNPSTSEEPTAKEYQKPTKGETDCSASVCPDKANSIADYVGSVKMVVAEEKESVSDNPQTKDSGSVVEEKDSASTALKIISTPVETVARADTPVASTSNIQEIDDEEEEEECTIQDSMGPSQLGAAQGHQDDKPTSALSGDVPLECEQKAHIPTNVILQEGQEATKEDLEVIQINLDAEQQGLEEEQARQKRIAATVSSDMLTDSQELLRLFGVPFVVSPMEAEAQCAALELTDQTDGSITDDSDVFLFGGRKVYKNIFNQNKHAELYLSDTVQRSLGVDRSKLISLAFITGSDYTEGIQGIGVVGAMEVLLEFPGDRLEGLKQFKKWHEAAQQQEKPVQETKVKKKLRSLVLSKGFPSEQVYEAYASPVVNSSTEEFEWGKPDLHGLRLFALDRLGWSRSRTDEILLPVLKEFNKNETQLKVDKFFEVQFEKTRKIQSKRVRRVVNRLSHPSSDKDSAKCGEDKDEERSMAAQEKNSENETREKTSTDPGDVNETREKTSTDPGDVNDQSPEQNLDGRCSNGDAMVGQKELQKQGSGKQKRTRLDVVTEQSPAKRTRSTALHSETELTQDGARCTRSVSERGTARELLGARSPRTRKPTPGRDFKHKDSSSSGGGGGPAPGRGKVPSRRQGTKRPLESSHTAEEDSTSSDSESGDGNCYTGPHPTNALSTAGRPRGRPRKTRGRSRGTDRARVRSGL